MKNRASRIIDLNEELVRNLELRIAMLEGTEEANRTAPKPIAQDSRAQLAAVDRQIAAIKAQLDQYVNDDPSLWPLRRELVALHNKRQELLAQQGVFDR